MSIITEEMDRLKGIALGKFKEEFSEASKENAFKLGYAYGMDDAGKIQEKIKILSGEAIEKL